MRWLTRKLAPSGEDRALTAQTVPPSLLAGSTPGPTVTPETALATADAYSCIRALSDAAASLPLLAYRRTAAGRERFDGPVADLLDRPAPAVTQANLVAQIVAHLNLYGNSFIGKFRNGAGRVEQLACLHPARVVPELRGGLPFYTVTGPKGERSTHGPADVIHVRGLSVDGLVGLSPVRQCRQALGLSSTLTEHAARFFQNDARPSGIIKMAHGDSGGPDSQLEYLRAAWTQGHAGMANAHRVAVMAGEIEFIPISMPADDAQFLEQRKLSATEVARIFRVPPWMIGADAGSSMTYANVEQQALAFVTYSLRPWLVLIEQALTADPDLFPAGTYCEFLLDALLRADSSTRAAVYEKALNPLTGWLSRAEVRRLENLPAETAFVRSPTEEPSLAA
jgi:HK97 family phage portal protein